ncbi:hypothetical protein F5Y12DRAFT_794542 [Xylaria sp. FL1777]|nr:hypothetical protein F5Y12DRAFT_794542 [Xylaria sp. FL1777]
MCTCDAFIYGSCRFEHCKFEDVSVCLAARLGLREKCQQQRIVNGHPHIIRCFPIIDGTCNVCHPEKAKAEEEEKKRIEKEEKEKRKIAEKEEKKKRKIAEREQREKDAQEEGLPVSCMSFLDMFPGYEFLN